MDPTETVAREGRPPDDRALLDRAAEALVAANRSRATVLDLVRQFHANRVAEIETSRASQPAFFSLTPLEATKAEFGPLLVMGSQRIETDLALAQGLHEFFPRLWPLCLDGRMDLGRAAVAWSYLADLTNDDDRRAYAQLVEEYLLGQDDPDSPLHPVRYQNLQQACRRRSRRFEQRTKEESFALAYAKRRVSLRTDDTGLASLSCRTRVDQGMQADYRLTLIAKKRAERAGETRTIEQLRADTLIDLLLGRVTVQASDADLEEGETAEGVPVEDPLEWRDIGKFARPVVNVTVPVTTLMGLSDTPGVLAGGMEAPAELCRLLASECGAKWRRLVTDPLGGFVELSTQTYQPSEQICAYCIAENPECIWPTCSRPSTVVDLDHRVPYPQGRTSTANLQPLCEAHHKVKHSAGFSVVREDDGSYTWTSRFGVVSRKPAPEHPVAEWPDGRGVRVCEADDESAVSSLLDLAFADFIAKAA